MELLHIVKRNETMLHRQAFFMKHFAALPQNMKRSLC